MRHDLATRLPLSYDGSTVVRGSGLRDPSGSAAIVAIPAHNEAERIGDCLASLAVQRDQAGKPVPSGTFEVLVFANNCSDATAEIARSYAETVPYRLHVIEDRLPPQGAHAGGARKIAMDRAAGLLAAGRRHDGVILTTDADSRAQPLWISSNLAALAKGVDAVAGYIDADAMENVALGAGFLRRGRLEDAFLSHVAEVYAILDPRPHDPWPNHRVHSGASFALTLEAYKAIGGLPCRALGEDAALAHALESAGFLVRHSMTACIVTSCRFDSRAPGGAGDTMRMRHSDLDAVCDDDLEPVEGLFRRARVKGLLRRLHHVGRLAETRAWRHRLGLDRHRALTAVRERAELPFAHLWEFVEANSPTLRRTRPLRPSDLLRETQKAERLLRRLRRLSPPGLADPAGTAVRAIVSLSETAEPSR